MPFGKSIAHVKRVVEPIRKKMHTRVNEPAADAEYIVGPINQHSAPHHKHQNREVDPVEPADGEGMFGLNVFHTLAVCGNAPIVSGRLRFGQC